MSKEQKLRFFSESLDQLFSSSSKRIEEKNEFKRDKKSNFNNIEKLNLIIQSIKESDSIYISAFLFE